MYVHVDATPSGAPRIELREADDCTRLHVTGAGLSDDQIVDLLRAAGAGASSSDAGQVTLSIDWLRESSRGADIAGDWDDRFESMLRYSEAKGWLRPDSQTLDAHVVRS
jgi:hypothetical protein